MGFLNRLFGGADTSSGLDVETAVTQLSLLYDDPEVVSERGISISGSRANEVRAVGRQLHKAGRDRMVAARDRFREKHGWAAANLETIWGSLAEWK